MKFDLNEDLISVKKFVEKFRKNIVEVTHMTCENI